MRVKERSVDRCSAIKTYRGFIISSSIVSTVIVSEMLIVTQSLFESNEDFLNIVGKTVAVPTISFRFSLFVKENNLIDGRSKVNTLNWRVYPINLTLIEFAQFAP